MRWRDRRIRVLTGAILLLALVFPTTAQAGQSKSDQLRADLDGVPIPLVDVGNHFCHDFAYPQIHCFKRAADLETRFALVATAGIAYVTIYDYTSYAGSYMHLSEDYSVLAIIGWNDRISSLRVLNSQQGIFNTDWYLLGTSWYFCCNSQYPSLGGYDNTFSSVDRY